MFRIITGLLVVLFGLWLLWSSLEAGIVVAIFGVIAVIVGGVIVLNKREDEIEEIKNDNKES